MVGKNLDLEGYGRISILPVNFKETEYENVDITGQSLTHQKGTYKAGIYTTKDGTEIPSSQICKKVELDGETMIMGKMSATKEVAKDDIEETDDNEIVFSAVERKTYKVFTDNKKLNELILKQRKTLKFPFVAGNGYKIYEGVLTAWKEHIVLVGVRGNINDALNQYADEEVELEIGIIPDKPQAKKLLKALAVARY